MAVAHKFSEKARTDDVISGESVDFAGLLLSDAVLHGLRNAGFERPSPIQLKAIPLGRCGLDLIVQAKSGTGKTCVFSVIALESVQVKAASTQVLVLAPTREIAIQIWEVIGGLGSAIPGLKCHTFIGGLPLHEDRKKLQLCHIAVGTPGRIQSLLETGCLKAESIRMFILDEADKLLEDNFQETVNWIYSALPENKQMLALSATYPEYLAQHLTVYMRNPTFIRLNITDPTLLGIKQYFTSVPNHPLPHKVFAAKTEAVVQLLSNVSFHQCLIFSNMQSRAQNLGSELTSQGWPTTCIAGCLDQKDRIEAMAKLKSYKCRVLISTDLTSRGIDADKVNLVINLDVPKDHETYLHRIGRAGRFGSYGAAVTVISEGQELLDMHNIEQKISTQLQRLPDPIPSDLVKRQLSVNLDDVVSTEQLITRGEPSGLKPFISGVISAPVDTRHQVSNSIAETARDISTIPDSVSTTLAGQDDDKHPYSNGREEEKVPSKCAESEISQTAQRSHSGEAGNRLNVCVGESYQHVTASKNFPSDGKDNPDTTIAETKSADSRSHMSKNKLVSDSGVECSLGVVSLDSAGDVTNILKNGGAVGRSAKQNAQISLEGIEAETIEETDTPLNMDSAQQRVSYRCAQYDGNVGLTSESAGVGLSHERRSLESNQVSAKPAHPSTVNGDPKNALISPPALSNGNHRELDGRMDSLADDVGNEPSSVISPTCVSETETGSSHSGLNGVTADHKINGEVSPSKGGPSLGLEQGGQKTDIAHHAHTQASDSTNKRSKAKFKADMWSSVLLTEDDHLQGKQALSAEKVDENKDPAMLKRPSSYTGKGRKKTELSWEEELALYKSERNKEKLAASNSVISEGKSLLVEADTSDRPVARARRRLRNENPQKREKDLKGMSKNSSSAGDGGVHGKSDHPENKASETDIPEIPDEGMKEKQMENGSTSSLSCTEGDSQQEQKAESSSAQEVSDQNSSCSTESSKKPKSRRATGLRKNSESVKTDQVVSKQTVDAADCETLSLCDTQSAVRQFVKRSARNTDGVVWEENKVCQENIFSVGGRESLDAKSAVSPASTDLTGLLSSISGGLRNRDSMKSVSYSARLHDYQQFKKNCAQLKPITASDMMQNIFQASRPSLGQSDLKEVTSYLNHFHKQLRQRSKAKDKDFRPVCTPQHAEPGFHVDVEIQTDSVTVGQDGDSQTTDSGRECSSASASQVESMGVNTDHCGLAGELLVDQVDMINRTEQLATNTSIDQVQRHVAEVDFSGRRERLKQFRGNGQLIRQTRSHLHSHDADQRVKTSAPVKAVERIAVHKAGASSSQSSLSSSESESEHGELSEAKHEEKENLGFFKNYYAEEPRAGAQKKKPKSKASRERRELARDRDGNKVHSSEEQWWSSKVAGTRSQASSTNPWVERSTEEKTPASWTWDAWYRAHQDYRQPQATHTAEGGTRRSQDTRPTGLSQTLWPHYMYPTQHPQMSYYPYIFAPGYHGYQQASSVYSSPWSSYSWYPWQQQWNVQQPSPSRAYPYGNQHHLNADISVNTSSLSQKVKADCMKDYVHSMAKFYKEFKPDHH